LHGNYQVFTKGVFALHICTMNNTLLVHCTTSDLKAIIHEAISEHTQHLPSQIANHQPRKDEYLTRKECAALLKVSTMTVHAWINKGILKHYKVGRRTLFKIAEIETLINNQSAK
jgi:excisionase family DNA binding protein